MEIILFSAKWCGPCQALKRAIVPMWLETLSNFRVIEVPERWKMEDMTPADREIMKKAQLRGIPAVVIMDEGEVMEKVWGETNIREIVEKYGINV